MWPSYVIMWCTSKRRYKSYKHKCTCTKFSKPLWVLNFVSLPLFLSFCGIYVHVHMYTCIYILCVDVHVHVLWYVPFPLCKFTEHMIFYVHIHIINEVMYLYMNNYTTLYMYYAMLWSSNINFLICLPVVVGSTPGIWYWTVYFPEYKRITESNINTCMYMYIYTCMYMYMYVAVFLLSVHVQCTCIWRTDSPKSFLYGPAHFSLWARWHS